MCSSKVLSRRQFLRRSGSLAAAGATVPYLIPAGVLASNVSPGANDRIGVGHRGNQLMGLPL